MKKESTVLALRCFLSTPGSGRSNCLRNPYQDCGGARAVRSAVGASVDGFRRTVVWLIMNARYAFVVVGLTTGLLLWSGCREQATSRTPAPVYRLFDLFQPEDLAGKIGPEDVDWKRVEWFARDMVSWTPPAKSDGTNSKTKAMGPALGFHPVQDLTGVKVDQSRLVAELAGSNAVLQLSFRDVRGGAESVKFVEVRMNVSGAKHVWLRPDKGPEVDDKAVADWLARSEPWNPAVDVADGKVQTYRFELSSGRGGGGGGGGGGGAPPPPPRPPDGDATTATNTGPRPPGMNMAPPPAGPPPAGPPPGPRGTSGGGSRSGDFRQLLLAFRGSGSGKVSIESVRFVTEREEKLKEASGQQWAGLGEIYHAALAAKTPEVIRIPVRDLPRGARLDFAYGTKEDAPVRFKVTVAPRDGGKDLAATAVFERTVTIPNRWETARIDLGAYAGKSVLVEFTLAGGQKGLWGYWGSPTVRSVAAGPGSGRGGAGSQAGRKPRGVIVLLTDTLRKDHLNIYGYARETVVHLKKFADEGVAFRHAISQGTWTKVSVPSIMTSLYPLTSTVLDMEHSLPASAKTMAEVFREEGYATVAYSSVPFTGKMNNMHQGYDELHENGSISDKDYNAKTSRHYVDRLIAWLKDHGDEPFFVFLHVFDPHSPFRPRPPYDTLWGAPGAKERMAEIDAEITKHKIKGIFGLPHKDEYVKKTGNDPDELLKIYKDWYDGSIRGMDAEIGRLLEALREMGLDQDTLMVWAADHGEEFWEHNQLFHGQSVYGELNQVPLVFRWPASPEVKKGVMIDQQVQNLDIMPTILALAGISGPTNMQGRSLVPLLNGRGVDTWQEQPAITQTMVDADPPPGGASSNKVQKPHFGIIDRQWKLVRKEVDPETLRELYAHPVDSLNLTNVIKSEGPSARVKPLEETLEAWKARARAAQLPSDDTMTQQLSSEELRRLRALGYVGGGTTTTKPAAGAASSVTNTAGATNNLRTTNAPGAR